jgi:hypothetical protein
MVEQEPHYDPAVEEMMETSGPDIGRVKNTRVAKGTAYREAMVREEGASPEVAAATSNGHLRYESAATAVGRTELAGVIASDAINGLSTSDNMLKETAESAKERAKKAADSYDALQEVSKPAHLAQENERLRKELAEAREKIAKQDGSSPS